MRLASRAFTLALALALRVRSGAHASDTIVGVVYSGPTTSEHLEGAEEPWEDDWWLPDGQYPDFFSVRSTIPDRPLFTVLGVNLDLGRCCPSPFFRLLMEALKAHPLFRKDPLEAEVVFFFHDTLRMCEWPHLQMAMAEKGGHDIGCVDAGGDGVSSWKGIVDHDHSCGWCCSASNSVFFDAVDSTVEKYGKRHTFVYFKNSQDTFFECDEFGGALYRCLQLDVPVRFVGFQLQWSNFERDDEMVKMYGVPGVNLLVPLLAAHIGMAEPDDIRDLCVERKYLASFSGQLGFSPIRKKVFDLKGDPLFHIYETDGFGHQDPEGYEDVLRNSVFGFVPRGDEHYTFRLTEVLAAGAVPVMIDDDFVSPYGTPDIWEWAVPLPESEVHTAAEVLGAFSPEEVCEMKKKGAHIWHYAKDMGSTVDGMLAGLARLIPSDATDVMTTTTPTTTASGSPKLTTASSAITVSRSQATKTGETTAKKSTATKSTATKTTATTTATTMWTAATPTTTTEEEETTTTTTTSATSMSNAQIALDAAGAAPGAIARLRFAVIDEDPDFGVCCASPFFKAFVDTLRGHPDFTPHVAEAHVVFFRHDTLRMCEWPRLAMKKGAVGDLGCIDADKEEQGDAAAGHEDEDEDSDSSQCGWCCPTGTDVFMSAVRRVVESYGSNHTFVYFKNAQDNFFECHEFVEAKVRTVSLEVDVRFVGFQLQMSQLREPANDDDVWDYPIPGVNLLVPLLPSHAGMEEPHAEREECRPRKYLASFSGQLGFSPMREKVFELEGKHEAFHIYKTDGFGHQDPEDYEDVLRESVFGFVPRGDEHYTFRLTEVLAAGAVPVVIDDDFVTPYGMNDLEKWAVRIPEDQVALAPMILDSLANSTRCDMKKSGAAVWHFARDLNSTVAGMLQGLHLSSGWRPGTRTLTATSTVSATQHTTTSGSDHSMAAPGGPPLACPINGGFEDGYFGEVPANWTRPKSRGSSGLVTDEQRRSGSKSVKFTGSGWQLIETGPAQAESLNVSSATKYTLSFWARASEAGDAVRTEFLVYPDFSSRSWHDHQLATASLNGCIKFHAVPDAGRWTRFTHEFIAAETSSAVRLSIGANSVTDMYVDDVVFSEAGAEPPDDAVLIASWGGSTRGPSHEAGDTTSEGNSNRKSEGQSASTVERVLVSVSVVLTLLVAGVGAAMSTNLLSRCGTHVAKCRAIIGLGGSPSSSEPTVLEYVGVAEEDSTSGEPLLSQGGAAPASDADASLRGWWQRFSSWALPGGRSLAQRLGEEGNQEEGRRRESDAAPGSKANEDTPPDMDSKDDELSLPRSAPTTPPLGNNMSIDPEGLLGPRPQERPHPPLRRPRRWEQFRADRDTQRNGLKMPKDRPDQDRQTADTCALPRADDTEMPGVPPVVLPTAARQPPLPQGTDRWTRALAKAR